MLDKKFYQDVRARYEAGQRELASYNLDLPAGVVDLYQAAWWWEYQARDGKEVPELPEGLLEWLKDDTLWYGEGMVTREELEEMEDRELLNAYTEAVHSYVTTNCM